jgi:hypothetical protein
MVPMARILVVGLVFIAAPCAFAELKDDKAADKRQCSGKSEFHVISLLCRPGERAKPKPLANVTPDYFANAGYASVKRRNTLGDDILSSLSKRVALGSAVAIRTCKRECWDLSTRTRQILSR